MYITPKKCIMYTNINILGGWRWSDHENNFIGNHEW